MSNSIISWGNRAIFGEDALFPSRKQGCGAAQPLLAAWMWNLCDSNVLKTFIPPLPFLCTTPAALPLTLMRGFLITKIISDPQGYFGGCVIPMFLQTAKLNPVPPSCFTEQAFPCWLLGNALVRCHWSLKRNGWKTRDPVSLQKTYLITIFSGCWFVRLTSQRNVSRGEKGQDVKSPVSPHQPPFPPNICQHRVGCRKNRGYACQMADG